MSAGAAARISTEAETAASEAAREAKAEAAKQAARPTRTPKASKDGWKRFVVDVWITNLNPTEFGVYKHTRNRAKTRQFTSDMDIFAEIVEDGERTGLIGYREESWVKAKGMDRRLIFKLFSDALVWRATMDLMMGRSLQQTIGARGLPVMTYSINTTDDKYITYLERSANKWPWLPENFSFFLMNGDQPEFYRLKRHLIDWGMDFTLYDQRGEAIGLLDGKVFSVGGKWKGKIKEDRASKQLLTVMKLFGGMMIFNPDCRRHMASLYREVKAGRLSPQIDGQEADLYMNPRRVR